jgi:hypothetical protein
MQRYKCQQFGHVWVNCKQPPCCVWCGGSHPHEECPEKGNAASIPTCCNCKLVDGEEHHPSNYSGYRHAMISQRVPKTIMGRVFSSSHTTPGLSFAVVLPSNAQQQQLPELPSVAQAYPTTVGEICGPPPMRHNQQVPSQSVQAPNKNN